MQQLVDDIAKAIRGIDQSGVAFKSFHAGAGPYGEPQLAKLIAEHLASKPHEQYKGARTCRTPDLLVPNRWAVEFKIVRPYGDNGKEAEHWSQNLLHPYAGNVSAIADALKLMNHDGNERRAIVVIAYEHALPKIDLSILVSAFELITRELLHLPLGQRFTSVVDDCVHPVHQRATVYGWQLNRF
jgi:hypothetical protein